MLPYERELIDKLLKDRGLEHLKSNFLYKRKYSEVLNVLNLPYWKNNLYKHLLTPTIWNSNYQEITTIINIFSNLTEEQKIIFMPLLTSNIWNSSSNEVSKIIGIFTILNKKQKELFYPTLTSNIWSSNPNDIKAIIDIFSNLNDNQKKVFIPFLSSTIWRSSPENIKAIINSKIWEQFPNLLSKSIWTKNINKIEKIIEIMQELGIEKYTTITCLNLAPIQIKALYNFMIKNNIDVIIDDKLNPIFNLTPSKMLTQYGINLKALVAIEKEREIENGLSK